MTWAEKRFEEIWWDKSRKYDVLFMPGQPLYESHKEAMVELLDEAYEAGAAMVDDRHGCVVR